MDSTDNSACLNCFTGHSNRKTKLIFDLSLFWGLVSEGLRHIIEHYKRCRSACQRNNNENLSTLWKLILILFLALYTQKPADRVQQDGTARELIHTRINLLGFCHERIAASGLKDLEWAGQLHGWLITLWGVQCISIYQCHTIIWRDIKKLYLIQYLVTVPVPQVDWMSSNQDGAQTLLQQNSDQRMD